MRKIDWCWFLLFHSNPPWRGTRPSLHLLCSQSRPLHFEGSVLRCVSGFEEVPCCKSRWNEKRWWKMVEVSNLWRARTRCPWVMSMVIEWKLSATRLKPNRLLSLLVSWCRFQSLTIFFCCRSFPPSDRMRLLDLVQVA